MTLVEHTAPVAIQAMSRLDLDEHERLLLDDIVADLRGPRFWRRFSKRKGFCNFIVTFEGVYFSIAVTGMFSIHKAKRSRLVLLKDETLCSLELLKRLLYIACQEVGGVTLRQVISARMPSGSKLVHYAYTVVYQ